MTHGSCIFIRRGHTTSPLRTGCLDTDGPELAPHDPKPALKPLSSATQRRPLVCGAGKASSLFRAGLFSLCLCTFPAGEPSKQPLHRAARCTGFWRPSNSPARISSSPWAAASPETWPGFAAATYLRGIGFIAGSHHAAVTGRFHRGGENRRGSSTGEKSGGAFHQPAAGIDGFGHLNTLPRHYFSDGMGEAIKYGCISDSRLCLTDAGCRPVCRPGRIWIGLLAAVRGH